MRLEIRFAKYEPLNVHLKKNENIRQIRSGILRLDSVPSKNMIKSVEMIYDFDNILYPIINKFS